MLLRIMRYWRIIWMIVVFFGLLSACTLPIKTDFPPEQLYRLSPKLPPSPTQARQMHLYVPPISINPALATDRIILSKGSHQLDFIAHSRWPERLDNYLHALIIDALAQGGGFQSVSSQLLASENNYRLLLAVREFQADYPLEGKGTATVHVSLSATLLRVKDRHIVSQHQYQVSRSGVELRSSQIVASLDAALNEVLQSLNRDL